MEVKELHDEMVKTFEIFKKANDKSEEEQKAHGVTLGETKELLEKTNTRMDEIETKLKRPALEDGKTEEEQKQSEMEKKAANVFKSYLRKGERGIDPEELKSLATDDNTDGGFLQPRNMRNDIIKKLIEVSPVRELATVETISKGDSWESGAEGPQDFVADWVGERQARPETQTGKLRLEKIPVHELYASPHTTQKVVDDLEFNIVAWLTERVARRFAFKQGEAFVSGDGFGKPEGLLTNADIAEVISGDANLLTSDGLIDLFYALPEFYANNSTWLMRRATVGRVRKLKDLDDQYLWQPGLAGTQPATLLGRPVREAIDMPLVAANAFPILFGDFRMGYTIVDRMGINVLRDPFSSKPFIEFYTTTRVGGQVVLAEAILKQKVSA